ARALLEFYRRQAHGHRIRDGRTGTLTVIQRFGSGLNLNVHFHTLVFDGVFSRTPAGGLTFHPAFPPEPTRRWRRYSTPSGGAWGSSCVVAASSQGTRVRGLTTRSPRRLWRWRGSWTPPSKGAWHWARGLERGCAGSRICAPQRRAAHGDRARRT